MTLPGYITMEKRKKTFCLILFMLLSTATGFSGSGKESGRHYQTGHYSGVAAKMGYNPAEMSNLPYMPAFFMNCISFPIGGIICHCLPVMPVPGHGETRSGYLPAVMKIDVATSAGRQRLIYMASLVILLGMVILFRRYEISRLRLRKSMLNASLENSKLRELDLLKSKLLAGISHEFRTPLTLIKGPLEELLEEENDMLKKRSLERILTNASRMLQLVNQLLELSRFQSDNYIINAARGNIIGFIIGIAGSFMPVAKNKSITLNTELDPDLDPNRLNSDFYYDPDIIEKIFSNLLSNALKFTSAGGKVTVMICMGKETDDRQWLEFMVKDTGTGIPEDQIPYIFNYFYRAASGPENEYDGWGIGLAYVKELVQIHGATIRVSSKVGEGTIFNLCFPMGTDHLRLVKATRLRNRCKLQPGGTWITGAA
jgi:signal transduction histidine kinase